MSPDEIFDWKHSLFKISHFISCLHDLGLAFELKQLYVQEWCSALSPQDRLGFFAVVKFLCQEDVNEPNERF